MDQDTEKTEARKRILGEGSGSFDDLDREETQRIITLFLLFYFEQKVSNEK